MSRLREKLAHAFAVDPAGAAEPTPEEQVAVDWLCRQVAQRHLTTPGLIALEMSRPLNYLAAQMMHFTEPAVWAIAPAHVRKHYGHFAAFLERRGSIEYMCRRVEEFEQEFDRRAREARSDPASQDQDDPEKR